MGKEELDWMNKHSEEVSRYPGKWIALFKSEGIVSVNEDLTKVTSAFREKHPKKTPCVFKVPRDDEEIVALRC